MSKFKMYVAYSNTDVQKQKRSNKYME